MNATASIVSKVWSFCTTLSDDEPAAALLARIKAERAVQSANPKLLKATRSNL